MNSDKGRKELKTTKELFSYLSGLPKDFVVLVNVRAEDYMRVNVGILKTLVNEEKLPGVYITVNKPYMTMKRVLEENGINIDKLYFVDCITQTAGGDVVKDGNVFYLDSPQNLTGLGVAMGEAVTAIPGKDKFLFLDTLSTLLLYHNAGTVAKFSHFLTGRIRTWGLRGILISLEREADPLLTSQLAQFCDAVVNLGKNG